MRSDGPVSAPTFRSRAQGVPLALVGSTRTGSGRSPSWRTRWHPCDDGTDEVTGWPSGSACDAEGQSGAGAASQPPPGIYLCVDEYVYTQVDSSMGETTTVRVHRATRDRLTQLSRTLHVDTAEEVVTRALDLLEADLFWRQWQQAHAASSPQERAEEASEMAGWEHASAQDWLDADR